MEVSAFSRVLKTLHNVIQEQASLVINKNGLRFLAGIGISMAVSHTYAAPPQNNDCSALAHQSLEMAADHPAMIISAEQVTEASKSLTAQQSFGKRSIVQGMPVGEGIKALPPHCRIEGYIAPSVRFLVLLPEKDQWNKDVLYASCDAFCGAVGEDMPVPGLLHGFASITTDGGHTSKRPFDGIWGFNNREGEKDFGYRASHHAAQVIKAVAKLYYEQDYQHAFITGFSKGGHAGIKSALKYPEDFDGILARAPVVRYQEINAVRIPWIAKANTREDGSSILMASDIPLLHQAAIESCDQVDGLKDGIIDDPRACSFDPQILVCENGADENCLSQEKIDVAKKFYETPKGPSGKEVYPWGLEVGSELDWPYFHAPVASQAQSFSSAISSSYIRYLAFPEDLGASYDWKDFNPEKEAKKLKPMMDIMDATEHDLKAFRDSGGKLMILHGWSDGAVSARMSLEWFNKMEKKMGSDVDDFAQLYLIPANSHGANPGDGPNVNESLEALKQWLETGDAPDKLLLKQLNKEGDLVRSRPVYPYPTTAKYSGQGVINDATNFEPYDSK